MGHKRRLSTVVVAGIGLALSGVVVFDIYRDWIPEGKPLWSTLAENAVPLLLAAALPVAALRLARMDREAVFYTSVARWTLVGTVTMGVVSTAVVQFQVFQGEVKPWLIVFQTTVVGAVAGLLVGYNTADLRTTRNEADSERRRWASLFQNDPAGIVDLRLDGDDLVVEAVNDRF